MSTLAISAPGPEAKRTACHGHSLGPSSKCLVVECGVCDGPVEVLPVEYPPSELAVIHCPTVPLIAPFSTGDVGKEFSSLLREPDGQDSRHDGELLHLHRCARDSGAGCCRPGCLLDV